MTTVTEPRAAERVMQVREVAEHLGCKPPMVYALVRTGQLRAIRVGRLVRIPESALAEFINPDRP